MLKGGKDWAGELRGFSGRNAAGIKALDVPHAGSPTTWSSQALVKRGCEVGKVSCKNSSAEAGSKISSWGSIFMTVPASLVTMLQVV